MRQEVDEETKDMVAAVAFSLRQINDTVLQTIEAWEKRDYWSKADRFLRQWEWADPLADELEQALRDGEWSKLTGALAALMPHFMDIEMKRLTRPKSVWQGAHARLFAERGWQPADHT